MNGGGEKKEIKMCRAGEAEVGRQRRIKWRGAYDSLAGLQRLPAVIQLLLKATFEKPVNSANNTGRKAKRLKTRGRAGESENEIWQGERGGECCF